MTKNNERMVRLRNWRKSEKKDKTPVGAKEAIDLLTSGMTVFTRFAFFIGFLALASYLGATQHLVTGVNLTDAFLLAALALALGFLALLIVVAGVSMVGAQMNFLVASAAAGATISHLSHRQKQSICVFIALVLFYTFMVPWLFLHIQKAADWVILLTLAVNFLAAAALAWFWDHVHELCKGPGQSGNEPRSLSDRIADGFATAGVLFMSSLMTMLFLALLDPKVVFVFALIGCFGALGFRLAFVRGKRVTPNWAHAGCTIMAVTLILSTFLVFLLPAFNGSTGVTKAFQMVSLNVPHATIDVSAANLMRLDRAAKQQGLPLQVCRNADGSATLTNIQVLWHTLGNTGLVELWSESSDQRTYDKSHRPRFQTSPYEKIFHVLGTTGLRVPLENSGLQVKTGSNLHCLELNGLHFDSNSSTLSDDAKKELAQQLVELRDSLSASKTKDGKVVVQAARFEIVGHADPRRRQNGTNEELASKRAEAVRDMVEIWIRDNAPQWSKATIKFRSEGAREQARKCDAMTGAESEACNAFNRRVVLRLTAAAPS